MSSRLKRLYQLLTYEQRKKLLGLQVLVIVTAFAEVAGVAAIGPFMAVVRLSGSRLDDAAKGGDIDLMVTLSQPVENPAWQSARLEAAIIMKLGEQKIDVVLNALDMKRFPIHEIAQKQGVLL